MQVKSKIRTVIIIGAVLLFTGCTQVNQTQAPTQTVGTTTQVTTTPAPAPAIEPVNTGQASAIANIKEILPDPNTITLKTNSSQLIKLQVQLDNGKQGEISNQKVTWTSEDTNIATVDKSGVVIAVNKGNTNIVIKAGNIQTKVPVTVMEETLQPGAIKIEVTDLVIKTSQISLGIGKTALLDAFVTLSNGTTNRDIIWTSEDETLVTVDSNGNVKRIGYGEVKIFAMAKADSRKKGTITIANKAGEIPQVINTPKPPDIIVVSAPNWVKSDNVSETTATINWEKVASAGTYKVYLNDKYLTSLSSTSYTLDNLSPNTNYRVSIIAVSGGDESIASITDVKTTAPGAPKNLAGTSVSDTGFTINWGAVSGASKYKVYKDGELLSESTGTSYTASSLIAGTTYNITITAIVNGQESGASSELAITLKPPAPSGLSSRNITPTTFTFYWTAVNGASSYKVYKNASVVAENVTDTSYTLTGLQSDVTYQMAVGTVNSSGETMSSAINVKTTKPGSPAGLNKSDVTATGFTLSWSAVTGASSYKVYKNSALDKNNVTNTYASITGLSGGTSYTMGVSSVIEGIESTQTTLDILTLCQSPAGLNAQSVVPSGFVLSWTSVNGASGYNVYKNGSIVATNVATTSYNVTGLTAKTSYNMTVSAVNSSGESSQSTSSSVTTGTPNAPSGLSTSNLTTTSFTLSWNAVPDATAYKVYKDGAFLADVTETSKSITGLTSGGTYNMSVSAIVAGGESEKSTPIGITTLAPPSAPIGLSSGDLVQTSFTLSWGAVSGATCYKVYKDSSLYADNVTSTTKSITGLSADTTYSMQVSAVNAGGESTKSTALSVTTLVNAPSAPTGLDKTDITQTSFSLSWGAVTGATSYKVYKDSSLYADSITTTSKSITGLTANTAYSMQVSAVNAGGESTKSTALSVTTLVNAPSAPTGLDKTDITQTSFSLSWGAVTGATGYKVYKDSSLYDGNVTTTSKSITGLTANTAYSMQVSAVNAGGESTKSSALSVTTSSATSYIFDTKWGSLGTGDGQLYYPRGVAIDSSGNVYVVDTNNYRIQKFTSTLTFITKWGSGGSDDGQFNEPNGVAIDSSGKVYVVDGRNSRIQKFNSNGTFITKWGSSGTGDGQFNNPTGVAIDSSGNVYVAEDNNNRIQKFTSTGTFITKWGSGGSGDGQFITPNGVAIDSSGNVYVADHNNRIQKFTSTGAFITKWGSNGSGDGQLELPNGVAVDSSGNVYVADNGNNRIQKFTSTGTFITKWGSYGSGDGQLCAPNGVAIDSSGNVFVTDNDHRIQKFKLGP